MRGKGIADFLCQRCSTKHLRNGRHLYQFIREASEPLTNPFIRCILVTFSGSRDHCYSIESVVDLTA